VAHDDFHVAGCAAASHNQKAFRHKDMENLFSHRSLNCPPRYLKVEPYDMLAQHTRDSLGRKPLRWEGARVGSSKDTRIVRVRKAAGGFQSRTSQAQTHPFKLPQLRSFRNLRKPGDDGICVDMINFNVNEIGGPRVSLVDNARSVHL
jgi:hypothetical protein